MHVMIFAVNTREPKDGHIRMSLTIGVNSLEHLQSVISRLMHIDGVCSIERGSFAQ